VRRWWGTLLWALANLLIGACAILPLGLGLAVLGNTTLFDTGRAGAGTAVAIVLVTLAVLGGLFAVVNIPFHRRVPPGAAHTVWPAAAGLVLAPFAIALAVLGT
jgi:hypothetical protein